MRFLELTLPTPQENVALDEALLDRAEESGGTVEILRLWEPARDMVVIGRSSRWAEEARVEACRAEGIEIVRRSSGGAAIVAGPGCLMYALVLSYELRPELRAIDAAHCAVLTKIAAALSSIGPAVVLCGTSDLALGDKKISGNSVRCKRTHFLYHGTILYHYPLENIDRYLKMPPRQPAYRDGRPHDRFVANFPAEAAAIRRALIAAWQADQPLVDWPHAETARLVEQRYAQAAWTESR